jgi:pimeloyl-ACP methyl ester carboxylesterase
MRRPFHTGARLLAACLLAGCALLAGAATQPLRSDVRLASGLRLSYLEWGTAAQPTLLLLHGKGSNAAEAEAFAAALAHDFHVYAVDARGCGFSDWAADGNYTVEAVVADLAQFAAIMGWGKVAIYGHSLGAVEGIAFAARYPRHAALLMLEDGGPVAMPDGSIPPLNPGQAAPAGAAPAAGTAPPAPQYPSWDAMQAGLAAQGPLPSPLVLEARYQRGADGKVRRRSDLAGWAGTARGADFTRPWPLVAALAAPTLLIRADHGLVPAAIAQAMADANPRLRHVTIANAVHNIHGAHQQEVLDQVLAFWSLNRKAAYEH